MVAWFAETEKPIHVLLTKADKLNRSERVDALRATRSRLAELSPFHTAALFSALDKTGVEEADLRVRELLGLHAVVVTDDDAQSLQVQRPKKTPAQGD